MPAPAGAPRIFVSHSHDDAAFCREYVNSLTTHGLAVWYDEHNLGWGALRSTIERELPLCQHFVAILSPTAVASQWVNAEIDAALELLQEGTLHTLTFVIAERCVVPLLLRRWKRIEGPAGAPVSVAEAVARSARIISENVAPSSPAPVVAAPPPVMTSPPTPPPVRPDNRLPQRLADLDYTTRPHGGDIVILPPLCDIPAGPFLMGSDKRRDPQAYDHELPQHTITLPAYQIARYPVTVAEYACAVRAGAVGEPPPGGWRPITWQEQLQRLDHPVVCVSWNDAVAYMRWLEERTRQPWRLPTEAEWEKAARGTDGRIYPWGDQWEKSRANTSDGGPETTTAVGSYPSGASPYGAQDMAGNVREWCSSLYKEKYPYTPVASEDAGKDGTNFRVRRGGSWVDDPWLARAACRGWDVPAGGYGTVGFRGVHGGGAGTA